MRLYVIKPLVPIVLILAGIAAFPDEPLSFRTEFQDVPPKYVSENGQNTGISYEIMKFVEERSGYRFLYEQLLVPLARVSRNMETGFMDIQFGLQKTPERERNMIFGSALYDVQIVGVMRIDDPESFASLSDIVRAKAKVLVPNGTGAASALSLVPDLAFDDGARSAAADLEMLRRGRGKILIYHNLTINYLLSAPENATDFRKVQIDFEGNPGFDDVAQYIVYSTGFPEEARLRIERVIAEAKASGELGRITDKYLK